MTTIEGLVERARLRQQLPPPRIRRAIRVAAGVTQAEAAEALDVSRQAFIHWELGERTPRRGNAEAYAQLLISLRGGDA
ncbi:helix-turn-helix transcriptional regulator [uncultured Jatrophihabitans sp.]|uniref:helix-turn-helix transcriptional regulator n=1 Tax=uncultured Jatrophihabitans sp. TaxID=1610747 RepID=UPI0035CA641C